MRAEAGSLETALMETAVTVGKEVAQSFMNRVLAVHTVTCIAEKMPGIVGESDLDDTEYKSQQPLKPIVKSLRTTEVRWITHWAI